jgi:PAS domain S-box-containing protein
LIIAIVLITSVILNLIFRNHYIEDEIEHTEEQVMAMSRLEAPHFAHHILKNELQIIHHHIVDYTSAIKNLSDIHIYNKEGYLVVDKDGIKKELPSDKRIQKAIESKSMLHLWDGYKFTHFEPILENKEVVGFLYMEYNADYLLSYFAKRRNYFAALTALITSFFISAGVILSRKITKPIILVTDASKKFAEGDLSVSVPVQSKDELGALAQNFNAMVDSLRSAKSEVESYTKNLEHVINLRTERLNNALAELQQEKEFIEKLLSTIGATIAVLDSEGKFVKVNRAWEELRGYTEEEVRGKYVWDLMPPDSAHVAKAMFEEMLVYKAPTTFKIRTLTKDGSEKIVLANNAVFKDENGDVKYIIASGIDITEKEYLEKHLMESQRLQSIATLITGLSHNFNNILVGVVGYAGLLRMELSSIEHQRKADILKYIDTIENSANRASELIKHLYAFSKKAEYETKKINLNDVINNLINIIAFSFPKSISVEYHLQDNLYNVNGDQEKIRQAILNICLNARDAMPEGGTLRIETLNKEIVKPEHVLQQLGKYAVIKISDTGHGIDEETKHRIFEPFFTTRGLLTHTGLGLSMAYTTIKNHNGYITVESEVGKGTTFTIFLPAA